MHYEIDLGKSGLQYEVGDSLSILPKNKQFLPKGINRPILYHANEPASCSFETASRNRGQDCHHHCAQGQGF